MASLDTFLEGFYNASIIQASVATILLLYFFYHSYWQYRDVPPGPKGIPLLGYWPFLKTENAHLQFEELKAKYGDIYSYSVTGNLFINLCSIKLIKEINVSKTECFTEKFSDYSLLTLSFGEGLTLANGESWKVQRKFYQQKFKEYGMLAMKENYLGFVYDMLQETVDEMRAMAGKRFDVVELLAGKCSRVIRRILFNDQGITEDEIKQLSHEYLPVIGSMTYNNLLLMGKLARYLVFPFMPSYRAAIRGHNRIQNILRNVINRHKENFDETQILDIIDCYYNEKKDRESKGDPTAKYFTDKALLSSVYQFVIDGVLTIPFFIGIFLEKLVQYPEEQGRIYQELIDVLGPDRQPTMDDKSRLPYTSAFIYEVIRYSDFFRVFPSLKCTKETSIQGYRIPKGAITFINRWCANHDPQVYEEPLTFNPSRFVTVPGKPKTELPYMFGIGKRNCMGEALTMIEAFLYVTTIVKNFYLTMPQRSSPNIFTDVELKICAHSRTQE